MTTAVRQRPTRRQLEVLRAYIAAGSLAGAAHKLEISETTARQHLSGLYRRTGCVNVGHAAYLLGRADASGVGKIGRRGRVMATKFQATLEGGPELAAALAKLDDAVRVKASKDALLAAGGALAEEWQGRVPVLDANYQHSLDGASRAAKTKAGTSGSVAPQKVPGRADGDQPFAYAARLEFGDADRPAEPSARPAFDTARERAVQAAGDVLSDAIAGVTR